MDNSYYNRLTKNCASDKAQMIKKGQYRFTVLTPYLIRAEKQSGTFFCDEPTQTVIDRSFDAPSFTCDVKGDIIEIKTEKIIFRYNLKKNAPGEITLADGRINTDVHGGNLMGTARTLDNCNGTRKLDSKNGKLIINEGILSTQGVAVLDDSKSLVMTSDGQILPRPAKETDRYYFCYGFEYETAIADFFRLTGKPPLIPRFALGNWWSRYKAYTQEEYLTLMHRFEEEKIPVTVATIDMDWHWTDVIQRFGNEARDQYLKASAWELVYLLGMPGWSGYTWNTELFPDPKAFLKELKDMNLKVTMNLHPHSGCRFFEDGYEEFADFMGADKEKKEQILFDITDKKFREGYFKYLHHPHEKDGVDFWWIDWQQSKHTATPGLDPLWALNHYHTVDNGRDGKRGLILSRFAGAGSHRYPLGFSGDTFQTWESLDCQPEFTARSSNIGYTWWSHDIGGHCFGNRDDELYLRWVQYGVFSPVNRLHSTSNEFMGKEPWKYRSSVRINATNALKFRHRLIPYLYTMNRLTARDGLPLVRPMYYLNPKDTRAYTCPNEYLFGTELIAAPITEPMNKDTNLAGAKVYLPRGRWTDIFNGRIYDGNKTVTMYRDEESIPVLAKEGAIIPLDANSDTNICTNPEVLEVWAYRGNGDFTLYEDDGETTAFENGIFAETAFSIREDGDRITFTIEKVSGDKSVLPENREMRIVFKDVVSAGEIALYKDGKKMKDCHTTVIDGKVVLTLRAYNPDGRYVLHLSGVKASENRPKKELLIDLISRLQYNNNEKSAKYTDFVLTGKKIKLPKELEGPVEEIDELK